MTAAALLAAAALAAPVNVGAAWRADQRFESHYENAPVRVIDCKRGPKGNVGCDYYLYITNGRSSGSNGNVSVTLNISGVWKGHDAIVRRHHRLVILAGQWLHWVSNT